MGVTHFLGTVQVSGVPTMGMSGIPATSGNVWFVNSVTGSNGNTGAADSPYATIATALSQATADNGDIIVCTAGHAESLSGAGAITINKSGIVLWGLGEGADRPTLTIPTGSATSTTFLVTSANFQMSNFVAVNQKASLVTFFSVQAADATISCECHDNATGTAALVWLSAGGTTTATRLNANLAVYGFTAASPVPTALVSLTGPSRDSNIIVDAYGKWSTAVVNFVGTAVIDVQISGYFYNASNSASSVALNVVDTITGSTWSVQGFDGLVTDNFSGSNTVAIAPTGATTIVADLKVPSANNTTNALERDVIGNMTDAAVTAVGTTKTLMAYEKGLVTMATVQSLDSTNNAFAGDVVGNKTDTEVFTPGTTKSLVAMAKGTIDIVPKGVKSTQVGVLSTGMTLFTIAGGPIELLSIMSICTTGGDATAATVLYTSIATGLSAVPLCGATGSVGTAAVNATVTWGGISAATAAVFSANGNIILASTVAGSAVILAPGVINATIGSGPTTTGTWSHYMRYLPMGPGVTVV